MDTSGKTDAECQKHVFLLGAPWTVQDVESFIKAWRDRYPEVRQTLDDMLDDYREHVHTGTPLDAEIKRGKL